MEENQNVQLLVILPYLTVSAVRSGYYQLWVSTKKYPCRASLVCIQVLCVVRFGQEKQFGQRNSWQIWEVDLLTFFADEKIDSTLTSVQ